MNVIYEFDASVLTTATFVADDSRYNVHEWSMSYLEDLEVRRSLGHLPTLQHRWINFEGELDFRSAEPEPKQALDFVGFSPAADLLGLRDSALNATNNLWGLVEVLPLRCRDADYSAIHATRHYDILDLANSTFRVPRRRDAIITFGSLGIPKIMGLHTTDVDEVDLFRFPEIPSMFCTQGFLDRLRELGITGYGARQVWPPTEEQLAEEARLLALQRAGKMHGQMHFRPESLEG